MTIAGLYEVGCLFGGIAVDEAAEFRRAARRTANHPAIVSDDAHLNAADAGMSTNQFSGVISLKLVEVSTVEQTIEHGAHVVRLAMVFRQDVVKVPRGACRFHAFRDRDDGRRL